MQKTNIDIDALKKQRENIFFSSHKIIFIFNIDSLDCITQVHYIEAGFANTDVMGKNLKELFAFKNQEPLQHILQNVRENQKQEFYECDFTDPFGELKYVNVRIVPSSLNNSTSGMFIIINDITESKNAIHSYNAIEEVRTKNETEFREAFDELLVGVVIHDKDTQIVYSNNEASKILGLTKEQLLGKVAIDSSWMFVYENLEPVLVQDFPVNKVLEIESSISNYKLGVRSKENKPITWVNVNATPFFNAQNSEIEKIIINFIDITEQKLAEDSLRRSEDHLSNIINNIGDPVFVKDKNSILLIVNDAFCKLFGLNRIDIIGKSLAENVGEDEREYFLQIDKEVICSGIENITEEFLTVRDGETLTVSTRKTRYIDNYGNQFLIGVVRDITESKKAQSALIESQRLGAIGEMASSIAHDFNNALQAIYGNLELAISDSELKPSTKIYLDTIKNMVNDTASRVQLLQRFGGKKTIQNKFNAININRLIEEVILQSRPLWKEEIEKKGLSILVKATYSSFSEVYGIDTDLRAALYNIIKNSVEAMPQGGSLNIQTSENEETICITISDTGIGMDEETKSRIFQPFYTTKGYELGRGLGMSGVYGIIKEHKGNIYIKHTAKEIGTTIEIALPIKHEIEFPRISEHKIAEILRSEQKKELKILWVDDNEAIRMNVCLMLEMLGYDVTTANSGKHAIELLQQTHFDVLFTDIGMPEMNGWQLADYVAEKFNQRMQVIIVSGWGAEINSEESRTHNVLSVISKPFDIDEIEKVLNSIR